MSFIQNFWDQKYLGPPIIFLLDLVYILYIHIFGIYSCIFIMTSLEDRAQAFIFWLLWQNTQQSNKGLAVERYRPIRVGKAQCHEPEGVVVLYPHSGNRSERWCLGFSLIFFPFLFTLESWPVGWYHLHSIECFHPQESIFGNVITYTPRDVSNRWTQALSSWQWRLDMKTSKGNSFTL